MPSTLLSVEEYQFILRHDFTSFIERSFYELNPQTPLLLGPHIEVIATKLEACRQGKINRLIINLPPRHLKSHCASIAFVAWCLGHHPAWHIICASYGQDLADKLARDCRNIRPSRLPMHSMPLTAKVSFIATLSPPIFSSPNEGTPRFSTSAWRKACSPRAS